MRGPTLPLFCSPTLCFMISCPRGLYSPGTGHGCLALSPWRSRSVQRKHWRPMRLVPAGLPGEDICSSAAPGDPHAPTTQQVAVCTASHQPQTLLSGSREDLPWVPMKLWVGVWGQVAITARDSW